MSYGFRVELDGVDVTASVREFSVSASLDNFCREATVMFSSPEIPASIDWAVLPRAPRLEIFTRAGENWYTQGKFYVERPTRSVEKNQTVPGLWGRSQTAALTRPFSSPLSGAWDTEALASALFAEVAEWCGLSVSFLAEDFRVLPGVVEIADRYPLDVLQELAGLAGLVVTTDRLGRVVVMGVDYAPSWPSRVLADDELQSVSESVDVPEYADRIRVGPPATSSGGQVALQAGDACLIGAETRLDVFVRVTDEDGEPLDGAVVDFSVTPSGLVSLSAASVVTGRLIRVEEVAASLFTELTLEMEPAEILSVYRVRDTSTDYGEGASIDGTGVVLGQALPSCDSTVRVTYAVDGAAKISLQALGDDAGVVNLAAECDGASADMDLFVNLACQCPVTIGLDISETSPTPGSSVSVLVTAEQGGQPLTGRRVYMEIVSGSGVAALDFSSVVLDTVLVTERTTASTGWSVGCASVPVASVAHTIQSVESVRRVVDDVAVGDDLYDSHDGADIALAEFLDSGTELEVVYWTEGARANVLNVGAGAADGTEIQLAAWVDTDAEEPDTATATVHVRQDTEDVDSAITEEDYGYDSYDTTTSSSDCDEDVPCGNDGITAPLENFTICKSGGGDEDPVSVTLASVFSWCSQGLFGGLGLGINTAVLFTDGTHIGPLKLRWDDADDCFYADGAYLREADA